MSCPASSFATIPRDDLKYFDNSTQKLKQIMSRLTLIEMNPDQVLIKVGHEMNSRGHCYISLDRRSTFLLVGTSIRNIIEGIELLTNEICSRSCVYESANSNHRPGYHKSFRTLKCAAERLPAIIEQYRGRFQRVVICSFNPGAFRLGVRRKIVDVPPSVVPHLNTPG